MVSKEQLVQIIEVSIDELIATFKATPFFFYTENDLHTHLYFGIFSKLTLGEWQCKTRDGKSSILLHKEYPTKERYSAKALKKGFSEGARGHFDLSIWNPDEASDREFRVVSSTNFEEEQQTFIAIELDLIERNEPMKQAMHHFKWDILKLSSQKNRVEHGYQLVFVRDWRNRGNFPESARKEAVKTHNVTVLYIEKDNDVVRVGTLTPKPFLNFEQIFK